MTALSAEARAADREARRDEVKYFQDKRSVGASEAAWRIYSFDMSGRYPAVHRLPVHLENGQRVIFETLQEIAADAPPPRTPLMAWFEWNTVHREDPGALHLYPDMPKYCVYDQRHKVWRERAPGRAPSVGRVHSIQPSAGDIYYLRCLLHNDHSLGATSFRDLRTVHDTHTEHRLYKDVCRDLGLLADDAEYHGAMHDAERHMMPRGMRELFATILLYCEPADPGQLFESYWAAMGEDFTHALANANQGPVSA